MYMDEYKRWLEAELEDFDLKAELLKIEGDEDAIVSRSRSSSVPRAFAARWAPVPTA